MRSAILLEPGKIEIRSVSKPHIGPNSLGVRIESCGVCSSNLPPWEGRQWFKYPFTPGALGHEATGTVEDMGEAVTGWKIGERVSLISQNSYAEYDVVESRMAVRLPKSLNNMQFPGEPLGCAMNVLERSYIKEGDLVCIVGIGFLGALLIQLAVNAGARVIAIGQRVTPLEKAKAYGAKIISLTSKSDVLAQFHNLTGGELANVVIEATGKAAPLDLAAELTRERGRLVIAGYHQDGGRDINMQLWNWRGLDVINAHERDPERYTSGIQRAIMAVEAKQLNYLPLITHTFPLNELNQALQLTRDRPEGFMKAIIMMGEKE